MTGMTPERLDTIRANLPTPDADLSRRERDAHDLLAEVERLRAIEAGVEALTGNYRNHYEMHGAAGDDYVVEDGRCVDVDDLLALLNPTEGETDE